MKELPDEAINQAYMEGFVSRKVRNLSPPSLSKELQRKMVAGHQAVARAAERYRTEQIVGDLYILIGNTTLKKGEKEGKKLANQLRDFMGELKKEEKK